jgi:hypothetical protein
MKVWVLTWSDVDGPNVRVYSSLPLLEAGKASYTPLGAPHGVDVVEVDQ